MNILGFDTCLNKTYLALKTNWKIYSEIIESTEDKYHSAFLVKRIVEILKRHNLKPNDINLIATNIGPGSFTGIRVGLTVARAFAQGTNAKTVGIDSLELISETYGKPALSILDARKNKAYIGNSKFVELIDLENITDFLADFKGKIITDSRMQEFLKEVDIESINFEQENKDYGAMLIKLAEDKFSNNLQTNWQELKPLYIQPPPIHEKKS